MTKLNQNQLTKLLLMWLYKWIYRTFNDFLSSIDDITSVHPISDHKDSERCNWLWCVIEPTCCSFYRFKVCTIVYIVVLVTNIVFHFVCIDAYKDIIQSIYNNTYMSIAHICQLFVFGNIFPDSNIFCIYIWFMN